MGSIPGLALWVKDPALPWVVARTRCCYGYGVGFSCNSDSAPIPGTSLCHRCSCKKKEQNKNEKSNGLTPWTWWPKVPFIVIIFCLSWNPQRTVKSLQVPKGLKGQRDLSLRIYQEESLQAQERACGADIALPGADPRPMLPCQTFLSTWAALSRGRLSCKCPPFLSNNPLRFEDISVWINAASFGWFYGLIRESSLPIKHLPWGVTPEPDSVSEGLNPRVILQHTLLSPFLRTRFHPYNLVHSDSCVQKRCLFQPGEKKKARLWSLFCQGLGWN